MTDAKFWNRMAENYAKSPISDVDSYEHTLGRTRSYLKQQDSVLELGCGTGSTALRLADAAGRITASDYSPAMIEIGRRKSIEQDISNVDFIVADAGGHGLPEAMFDTITAFNLLHLIEDLDGTLAAIARKVRPGGFFISKTPCLREPKPGLKLRAMMVALPIMQAIGKAPFVGKFSIATLERAITSAGFDIIETGNYPARPPNRYIVARKAK